MILIHFTKIRLETRFQRKIYLAKIIILLKENKRILIESI